MGVLPDLWCSKFRRNWPVQTISSGDSQTFEVGSNHAPIVGWLWVWKFAGSGVATGTIKVRAPGPGTLDGTVASDFTLSPSGSVVVPWPVSDLTVTAAGADITLTVGAYPVESSHAAGLFPRWVEDWDVFELTAAGGLEPSKSLTVPTGADLWTVEGPSGASDGATIKNADQNGNTPGLYTLDNNAHAWGVGSGTPWRPVYPAGSITVENLANSAEYYAVRFRFNLATFGP